MYFLSNTNNHIDETTGKPKKAIKTEDKIEVLTKTLKTIFTDEQNKPHFNINHKETVESHKLFKPLKTIPINYKFTPDSITKTEITNKINKLNTTKAAGPDKISNTIIQ